MSETRSETTLSDVQILKSRIGISTLAETQGFGESSVTARRLLLQEVEIPALADETTRVTIDDIAQQSVETGTDIQRILDGAPYKTKTQ